MSVYTVLKTVLTNIQLLELLPLLISAGTITAFTIKSNWTVLYWGTTVGAIKFSTVTTAVPNAEK